MVAILSRQKYKSTLKTNSYYFLQLRSSIYDSIQLIRSLSLIQLLPISNNSRNVVKICFFIKEGIMKNNSYEHRVYELVDDLSLSHAISQNLTGKRFRAVMGFSFPGEIRLHGFLQILTLCCIAWPIEATFSQNYNFKIRDNKKLLMITAFMSL